MNALAAIGLVASALLLPCCQPSLPDCGVLCTQLRACNYLPSTLGSGETASDAQKNCEARCNLSTSGGPYADIDNCYKNHASSAECQDFGQCLRQRFPGAPVTGLSNVSLTGVGEAFEADASLDAGAGCGADAGTVLLVRGFVETWGTRIYGETRTCEGKIVDYIDRVPADLAAHVGFQFAIDFHAGECREVRIAAQIPAGSPEVTVSVPLTGPGSPCTDIQQQDALHADAGARVNNVDGGP